MTLPFSFMARFEYETFSRTLDSHLVAVGRGETPICCCRTEEDRSAPPGDTRQGR